MTDSNGLVDLSFLDAATAMSATEQAEKIEQAAQYIQPVEFPRYLYVPEGAEGIDLRSVWNVPPATIDFEMIRFVAPPGSVTRFIAYGVFNDGDVLANYDFKPFVNGNRVFRYHGQLLPSGLYKIGLGLGPDLSNASLVNCQITLNPGDIFSWFVTNISLVDTSMGVRMVGYFDTQQIRVTPKFG